MQNNLKMPNYTSASSLTITSYSSSSKYWTAPFDCYLNIYQNAKTGKGDYYFLLYCATPGSSKFNIISGGGSGTYSGFNGSQTFIPKDAKVYLYQAMTDLNSFISCNYYPLG